RPPDLGRQKQRVGENTMNLKCREASEGNSPPQLRRGGRDIKKNAAKPPLMERTGWCWSTKCIWFINTTPSARGKVASRLFLNRAATPPHLRRGVPFGCFTTCIEKSAHPEFLDVRRANVSASNESRLTYLFSQCPLQKDSRSP